MVGLCTTNFWGRRCCCRRSVVVVVVLWASFVFSLLDLVFLLGRAAAGAISEMGAGTIVHGTLQAMVLIFVVGGHRLLGRFGVDLPERGEKGRCEGV